MVTASNHHSACIVSRCTPVGSGAIALIRVSGPDAASLVDKTIRLASGSQLSQCPSHTIQYGHVIDTVSEEHLDQVLFFSMKAPRTFTGEDVVEITCHNNEHIIDSIVQAIIAQGARHAKPGEFTQRAVMNGKLDMVQAEALHELIVAPTAHIARTALRQLEGSLSHVAHLVEQDLMTLAVWLEASFEFLDEEQRDLDFADQVSERLNRVRDRVEGVLSSQGGLQLLKDGVRVALMGGVNAGKSTLLNAFVGKERAIVSHHAGTTRDTIEVSVSENGYSWTYIDTAGLRNTDNEVEQVGIQRSWDEGVKADVIVLVIDQSAPLSSERADVYAEVLSLYKDKCMVVLTKSDQPRDNSVTAFCQRHDINDAHSISVHKMNGIRELKQAVHGRVVRLYQQHDTPYILNVRQQEVLQEVARIVRNVYEQHAHDAAYELMAADVQQALMLLTDLTGKSISEQVMDKVFSSFCVGK